MERKKIQNITDELAKLKETANSKARLTARLKTKKDMLPKYCQSLEAILKSQAQSTVGIVDTRKKITKEIMVQKNLLRTMVS